MPRSVQSDPYMSGRFHVVDSENKLGPAGSFATCSLPDVTFATAEYNEGTKRFTKKYPGKPSVSDVSLTKGVFKSNTAIYDWIKDMLAGNTYRVDLEIYEYHHTDVEGLDDFINAKPSRIIRLFDVFPIRFKAGSDKDSSSDEVSLEELDLSVEKFEVIEQ